MSPIEVLTTEHKAIKSALVILENMCKRLEEGESVDKNDIEGIIDFIKGFADACHHCKEEEVLFRKMQESGFPVQGGPITVMLSEHQMAREFVKKMSKAIEGRDINRDLFVESARGYIKLLSQHIDKENNILYPLAEEHLAGKDKEIIEEFDKIEEEKVGEGKHEEYHRLLEKLANKYLENGSH